MSLLSFLHSRRRRERELDDEIQAHLSMALRDRIDRGESAEEARHTVQREFGNTSLVKEVTRDMWGSRWMEYLSQDVVHSFRLMRRNPAFSAWVVIPMGLAAGIATAVFSLAEA